MLSSQYKFNGFVSFALSFRIFTNVIYALTELSQSHYFFACLSVTLSVSLWMILKRNILGFYMYISVWVACACLGIITGFGTGEIIIFLIIGVFAATLLFFLLQIRCNGVSAWKLLKMINEENKKNTKLAKSLDISNLTEKTEASMNTIRLQFPEQEDSEKNLQQNVDARKKEKKYSSIWWYLLFAFILQYTYFIGKNNLNNKNDIELLLYSVGYFSPCLIVPLIISIGCRLITAKWLKSGMFVYIALFVFVFCCNDFTFVIIKFVLILFLISLGLPYLKKSDFKVLIKRKSSSIDEDKIIKATITDATDIPLRYPQTKYESNPQNIESQKDSRSTVGVTDIVLQHPQTKDNTKSEHLYNYYDILQIRQDASDDEIEDAYYDRTLNAKTRKEEEIIQTAYEILSDEKERERHDKYLKPDDNTTKKPNINAVKNIQNHNTKKVDIKVANRVAVLTMIIFACVVFILVIDLNMAKENVTDISASEPGTDSFFMNEDKVSALYKAASSEYADAGDYEGFKEKLKNPEKRKILYDRMISDGYSNLGTYGEFEKKLGIPMMNENLVRLHKSISERDPDFKVDFETFAKDMQDEENLKNLHSNIAKRDPLFTVPYDEFKKDMGFSDSKTYNEFNRKPGVDDNTQTQSNTEISTKRPGEILRKFEKETKYSNAYHLKTGDSPYNNYFGEGMIDSNSLCEITVKNGTNQDAIVIFINIYTDKCMRNIYIGAHNAYTITQIPEGTYKMKCYYGNEWDSGLNSGVGFPIGGFKRNASFEMPSSSKDYFEMQKEETHEGYNYSTYTVTLHKVVNGNMHTKDISKNDFFE
jgi:curved DNA-binding protein CbpA